MSKHLNLPGGHPIELVPQMTASMEYHVPFEWGELAVTSEADQAYDLTPLANTLPGGPNFNDLNPYAKGRNSKIVFILAGPGENNTRLQDGFWSTAAVAGKLSIYAAGFTHTKQDIIETNTLRTTNAFQRILGSPDLAEQITFGDGLSLDQVMEQSASMLLVHSLAAAVVDAIRNGDMERQIANVNLLLMHRLRTLGLLGSMGVPPVVMAGSLLHSPGIATFAPSITTSLIMAKIMSTVGRHLQTSKATRDHAIHSAEYTARQVGDDVHATFCRQHFDQTLEKLVFDTPDDEV